ncbi:uncharacterized protein EV420DRAFT_1746715 [Desarmillaria tabescens]|uniref:Uncharacterized protein n=1 Tax=Armillaria tabescens TaxID=1929756 RepID=A0AA39KI13_ARMTA|nr:uncharacterized protein EV420DRAFT_1746715 [Desarmillaria tabescens]KAK0460391.1 hypothetical protein EV420DRAFT_1746715 [Desarmillaria tabescens]
MSIPPFIFSLLYAFHYGNDLGSEPHRQRLPTLFTSPPSDFDPTTSVLSSSQNSTISYRYIHDTKLLVIYKTMYEYAKDPTEIRIWQLQHDEWADCHEEEEGEVSVRCLGCSELVVFDVWEAHRDGCSGIEDKMVRAVMADMVNEEEEEEERRRCWTIRSLRGSPVAENADADVEIQDDEVLQSKRRSLGMRLCSALHFIGNKHSKE